MVKQKGNKTKILVTVALLLLLLFILSVFAAKNAGTYLLVSDPVPSQLDLVFTFAGENARDIYTRELMQKFPDAHWLLSDYKNGYVRILRREKFDMSRVTVVDTCKNTYSEVVTLCRWIDRKNETGFKTAVSPLRVGVISGPYHMRRIKMMIDKIHPERDIVFYYLPVPLDRYSWTDAMFRSWWNSPVYNVVTSEFLKIIYFVVMKTTAGMKYLIK